MGKEDQFAFDIAAQIIHLKDFPLNVEDWDCLTYRVKHNLPQLKNMSKWADITTRKHKTSCHSALRLCFQFPQKAELSFPCSPLFLILPL